MLFARIGCGVLLCIGLGAVACSSNQTTSTSITGGGGSFHATLSPGTAKLVIAGPDGAPLLDGIAASSDVGMPQSANDDAPPMTGFAVRLVPSAYQMQFGSFSVVDDTSHPWRVARSAKWPSADKPIDLLDATGARLASLQLKRESDDGHLAVDIQPGDGPERRFSWGFRCDATDRFFGFGAQTWGVGARGETIPIWVQEEGIGKDLTTDDPRGAWFLVGRRHSSGMPLPEFLSRRGFIAVAETTQRSTFALCSERDDVGRMELELPAKLHLFYGPSPKDAVTRMTAQFGRPRVPPAFAFAPWNDAIFGSANVRAVANKLRAAHIPSSVIWTEDWRGGAFDPNTPDHYALKEEWDVDRSLYPDFEAVASDLHKAGFKWLVYFNSFVEQTSKAFPETAPNGYLIKAQDGTPYMFQDAKFAQSSLVDLSNPDAVAWAVGKMKAAIAIGADGWMGDYGEWLPTDAMLTGGSGLDLHNVYPQLWQLAQRTALDEAMASDGVERLSFVRSGWLGSPPLVDVWWPGDQRTDFEPDDGMPNVVPMGVGVGLSGISTYGSDIAGYQNATNGPVTKELFFRWTELGAWSPVMRTHHGSFPKLNWSWQSDDESTAHWARYSKLHIALAPYLRGLAQTAHETGVSIMRALPVEFPSDDAVWPIADEYLLGASVLVSPVQVAGATSRDVYLPRGTWYPWSGGPSVAGGQTTTAQVPMGEIPVYALAGAIVPTYQGGVDTLTVEASNATNASTVKDDRSVYAFAGAPGSFVEAPRESSPALSYAMDSAWAGGGNAAGAAAAWNGVALAACPNAPVAPCVVSAPDGVTAYVVGPGSLAVTTTSGAPVAVITATGGDAERTLTMTVRM